ncbi:hypothetical protein PENTCL1PPCAC_14038, partial [Pristionchus entomophagus]
FQRPFLFSFACGHVACHSCWLVHAKHESRARSTAISCLHPSCDYVSNDIESAALFSDGTIDVFH